MDVNDLRITVTLISLALFLVLMWHTWSRRRKAEFEHAAMLPFSGDLGPAPEAQAKEELS